MWGKQKEKEQWIVCYDIENSVIYEVYDDTDEGYERTPQTVELRKLICKKLNQADDKYIDRDNAEKAQAILDTITKKTGLNFVLAPMTHKYLSNYYIYNNTTKKITSEFARTPEEDCKIMSKIIGWWKNGDDVMFTAHNLDYEYGFIRYNTTMLQTLLSLSKEHSIIANGTHDIKSIEFVDGVVINSKRGGTYIPNPHKFIIRDSLLMTNKSIKNLGKAYKLPKLDYDYEVTRTDPNSLEEADYTYNQRDNEIALRAILEIQAQNPLYQDITKLPMSATQHSRTTCRCNPAVNLEKGDKDLEELHRSLSKTYNMPNAKLFAKFFNASGGGLIGVNPEETYKWHDGVYSFDIKSAHPSQAFNKRFPMGEKTEEVPFEKYAEVIKELKSKSAMLQMFPKEFYNTFNPSFDYLLCVELKGVSERNIHGNIINSLGSGIARNNARENEINTRQAYNINPISKHGKTRYSDSYTKWFYGVDLIYHLSFYDIDEIIIHECYKYPLANADEYIMKKFEFYGSAKEEYKMFANKAKELDFETIKEIVENSNAEEYTKTALSADNYVEFLAGELLRIKGIFNGIFGQEYQNPVHDDMIFTDDFEIIKDKHQNYEESISRTSVHYCVGAYIAMWTRFELACMMWHVINNGGSIFYWATDSVKCSGVPESIFDDWCYGHTSLYYQRNKWNFGAVDCENKGNPMSFFTPETLKHIDISVNKKYKEKLGDRISVGFTVSGFKADIYLKDFLDEWTVRTDENKNIISEGKAYTPENIEEAKVLLAKYFEPQIIPPEKTGKLVRDRRFAGIETALGQVNFGALQPIGYNLGGYNCEDDIIF